MNGERIESVWDLLSARIAALEAKVEALEGEVQDMRESSADAEAGWIGGNDD